MFGIQIITHPYHDDKDFIKYDFIRDCPKNVNISESGYIINIDGRHYDKFHHTELLIWMFKPKINVMSLELCGFFYNTIGFVPFIKMIGDRMYYDSSADPSFSKVPIFLDVPETISNKLPVMVELMGVLIPKALVKEMRLIQDNVDDVGDLFKFKIEEDYFPEDLKKHVKSALEALLAEYSTTVPVQYLYIYEMLGISLTGSSFIIGDELFPLTVENLKSKGVFRDWCARKCALFTMPGFPKDKWSKLSEDDASYITDNMIEKFKLCDIQCVSWEPGPFEVRIRAYNARKLPINCKN
jgi:hypothetical protein